MVKKDKEYKERMIAKKKRREEMNINRDEYERRNESLQIIYQLKQNNINSNLSGIRTLLEELSDYVKNGIEKDLTIPLPEMNKNIKCYLPIKRSNKCEVILKQI